MTTPQNATHAKVSEHDRAAVQRRTLIVLSLAAVLSRGAVSSMFPVAVSAIKEILGNERWAGLATAGTTVGSAVTAAVLANYMQKRGRNPGLTLGFAVAVGGAVLGIIAIEAGRLSLFLVAMLLIGAGAGTANLSRYAAADLAPEHRRSRDLSTVIFASTFGAVAAPLFLGVAADRAGAAGYAENVGGFVIAIGMFLVAAIVIFVFLRPDPLVVAGGVNPQATRQERSNFRDSLRIAWSHPMARLAFVALVVSQAVMVMVMAMTPLHMEAHGHGKGAVGQVISAHTAGMFAFAPIAGWLSDRIGRVQTIYLGGITLIAATILTALAGEAPKALMFAGLFLLGLGWSFGLVAGSALLTESVDTNDRVGVQGAADMATNIASGAGALSSGLILNMAGYHILSFVGMAAAAALIIHASFEQRLTAAT